MLPRDGATIATTDDPATPAPTSRPIAPLDARTLAAVATVGCVLLGLVALREYMAGGQYVAAPDYVAEMLPPIRALGTDGLRGYIDHLPGYPGIAMLEYLPAQVSLWFGAGEATTWRVLSWVGIAAIGLSTSWALRVTRGIEISRTAAVVATLLAVASPAAYWALRIGHPEELFATGLILGATVAAARERPVVAGLLLGLAVGKAWPAVVALPVLGLLLPDPRRIAMAMIAAIVAAGAIFVPALFFASSSVRSMTDLGQSGIFNVGQVFWWFGEPVARSIVDCVSSMQNCQTVPQPRGHGPVWSGELSHPLILGVGTALGLVWAWTLHGRFTRSASLAALRTDGRTRSAEETARLLSAALLVMAGILYARCFLDTWNVPYYLLPALVFGALGELLTGRAPVVTAIATAMMWRWHAPGDLTVRSAPDVYTALYLAWTIPVGVSFVVRGFKILRTGRAGILTTSLARSTGK